MNRLKRPIFITNGKMYPQAMGNGALDFVRIHNAVAEQYTAVEICFAPSVYDIYACAQSTKYTHICAQHIDAISESASLVGFQTAQAAVRAGAQLTLLNHSAHRLQAQDIQASVQQAQEGGLRVVLCAESLAEVESFSHYNPDAIAYEPPELIGSSSTSVSRSQPEIIKKAVYAAGNTPLLVGAGVSTPQDITTAMQLGVQGFLVASAIIKADNPQAVLQSLIKTMYDLWV